MTALLAKVLKRRTMVKALLALPAFAIFRDRQQAEPEEEIVEVDGWILKRSDLA